jgi:glycerophosphoryl diester phosphodiesterase
MVGGPHPQSVICARNGRQVQLKVHQCVWSGNYWANSLPAIQECYQAHVARAEIDLAILSDEDFLVAHDLDLAKVTDGQGRVDETTRSQAERLHLAHHGAVSAERPVVLSDVAAAVAREPYPTLLELDLKDWKPWPWSRVEELARLLQPIKDRITFGGGADWNLRRLLAVDPSMPLGFTITSYLDWVPEEKRPRAPEASREAREVGPRAPEAGREAHEVGPRAPEAGREAHEVGPGAVPGVRGAYGYLDAHPLARERHSLTPDYLRDRLGAILRLVPGARDIHVRLQAVERMLDDGLTDLPDLLHAQGMLLDVWTLNAGTPNWRERLTRALDAGVDVITTETPHELALAGSER